jgi:hypothetical protein
MKDAASSKPADRLGHLDGLSHPLHRHDLGEDFPRVRVAGRKIVKQQRIHCGARMMQLTLIVLRGALGGRYLSKFT